MKMSSSEKEGFNHEDVVKVTELAVEPSYISEIARILIEVDDVWSGFTENTAVRNVSKIVNMLSDRDEFDVITAGADIGGQVESSPKRSFGPGGFVSTEEWRDYKIIHNPGVPMEDIREEYQDIVDPNMTVDGKLDIIETLSKIGNQVSKDVERIMQDVMDRQFRYYDIKLKSDYNDSGVDYLVEDEDRREWGLAIEISSRWVNPIDKPYLEHKKDLAFDRDFDLLIMAPRFTKRMIREYEDPTSVNWHKDPLSERVHLHLVPDEDISVYKPFVKSPVDIFAEERSTTGNPVVIPDTQEMREHIKRIGHVGDDYPVVEDEYVEFRDRMDLVLRDFRLVTESMFRNQIREALEPLLWEFLRPYKVEQFIIDTYWDHELNQEQIGGLVDRTGGTIRRWMMNWGIIRRGTGAPELSDEVREIWERMYLGQDPFPETFSGYRIQAEYNRHPLWGLDDWEEWYQNTTEQERQETVIEQGSYRDNIDYTVMTGVSDRLLPSYTFIISVLRDMGIEIRRPDEAPRGQYNAYASRDAIEWMINRNQNTIVDVSTEEES